MYTHSDTTVGTILSGLIWNSISRLPIIGLHKYFPMEVCTIQIKYKGIKLPRLDLAI
mgnify:FL=1